MITKLRTQLFEKNSRTTGNNFKDFWINKALITHESRKRNKKKKKGSTKDSFDGTPDETDNDSQGNEEICVKDPIK